MSYIITLTPLDHLWLAETTVLGHELSSVERDEETVFALLLREIRRTEIAAQVRRYQKTPTLEPEPDYPKYQEELQ